MTGLLSTAGPWRSRNIRQRRKHWADTRHTRRSKHRRAALLRWREEVAMQELFPRGCSCTTCPSFYQSSRCCCSRNLESHNPHPDLDLDWPPPSSPSLAHPSSRPFPIGESPGSPALARRLLRFISNFVCPVRMWWWWWWCLRLLSICFNPR